ncbi:MAG: hypothetical protein WA071_15865, partial [Undibacterium umbellatum]|uniref:hypothetical protein n=1 Tax=Undibacterium umbellatum TaxID=2762300 RepID=UPI003BB773F9
ANSLASACSLLLSIAFVVILAIPHYRRFIGQNYLHTFIYRLAAKEARGDGTFLPLPLDVLKSQALATRLIVLSSAHASTPVASRLRIFLVLPGFCAASYFAVAMDRIY